MAYFLAKKSSILWIATLFLLVVSASWFALPVKAQSAAAEAAPETLVIPDGLTAAQVDMLIAPLTDKDARFLLRSSLMQNIEKPTDAVAGSSFNLSLFLEQIRNGSSVLSDNYSKMVTAIPTIGGVTDKALLLLTDLEGPERMWLGIYNLLAMIVFGFIASRLVSRLFGGIEKQFLSFETKALGKKFNLLVLRAAVKLVQLVAFFVTGQFVSLLYFDRYDPMRLFLLAWFGSICVFVLATILCRIVFSPAAGNLRLVALSDQAASNAYNAVVWAFSIGTFTMLNMAMFTLLGVPNALLTVWQLIGGTIAAVVIVVFFTRKGSANAATTVEIHSNDNVSSISSADPDKPQARLPAKSFKQTYTLLKVFGCLLLYALWVRAVISEDTPSVMAVILIMCALFTGKYINSLKFETFGSTSKTDSARSYFASHAVTSFFGIIAAIGFVQTAGLDIYTYSLTPNGAIVKLVVVQIMATIVIALLTWNTISSFLARYVKTEIADAGDRSVPSTSEVPSHGIVISRIGTLLPLFRGFALALVVVVSLMFILTSLGINIGPLVAGAGVLGIAIGFGAQTLVKDIFSGIFFLIDDAFRVGEYVETGTYSGFVERISIRSMQLRHHLGPIHTVPFGELRAITNHNRDWVVYRQDFELPYETDIEEVARIIKAVGLKMLDDPILGPSIISPVRSQGVKKVENGALIIGTEFKSKPIEHWVIRHHVYQEVRDALYIAGIHLATRRVQVEMPDPERNTFTPPEAKQEGVLGAVVKVAAASAALTVLDEEARQKISQMGSGPDYGLSD